MYGVRLQNINLYKVLYVLRLKRDLQSICNMFQFIPKGFRKEKENFIYQNKEFQYQNQDY